MEKDDPDVDLPVHLRSSLIFKLLLQFNLHFDARPEFYLNYDYLSKLVEQERAQAKRFGRMFLAAIVFSVAALLYVEQVHIDLAGVGVPISEVPGALSILSFLLGLAMFGMSTSALDMLILARIRTWIVTKVGTDVPATMLAHIKGEDVWIDLFTPKSFGYKSSRLHVTSFFLVVGFMIFLLLVFFGLPTAALWASMSQVLVPLPSVWGWREIIAGLGGLIGLASIFLILVALVIPYRFFRD